MPWLSDATLVHVCLLSAGAMIGTGVLMCALLVGHRDHRVYAPYILTSFAGTIVFLALAALYGASDAHGAALALRWHVAGVLVVGPSIVWLLAHVTRTPLSLFEVRLLTAGTLLVLVANDLAPASLHFTALESPERLDGASDRAWIGRPGVPTVLLHLWQLVPFALLVRLGVRLLRHGDRATGAVALATAVAVCVANANAARVDLLGGRGSYVGGPVLALYLVMMLGVTLGVSQRRRRLALEARSDELRRANAQLREEGARRLQLEKRFAELERFESLGRMAAGVAHDFNNVLTVVGGHAALVRGRVPEGSADRHDVDAIGRAADRGAQLTRQLLAFARRQELAPGAVDTDQLVVDSRELLSKLLGGENTLHLDLDARGRRIHADAAQLAQVVMNLVANAGDAMPGGGDVTIATRVVPATSAPHCSCRGALAADHLQLSVLDTGCGIDPATLPRIFEPFFTTKEPEKGTGLGLATVHGIVTQSGAQIAVESRPGEGAAFRICWPLHHDGAGEAGREAGADTPSSERSLTPA